MAQISEEGYLALSSLAYNDFSSVVGKPLISELISEELIDNSKIELSALSSMQDWTLLGTDHNSISGFSASAFQAPDGPNGEPGQIVFAFAGTDMDSIEDLATDLEVAVRDLPAQFSFASQFVTDILTANSNASYSFTGHSLGGGIAQYMTYDSDNVYQGDYAYA